MLLKIKQTRFSNTVSVFDKISQVDYDENANTFYSQSELPEESINEFLMIHELSTAAEKFGEISFGKQTNTAFTLNRISFVSGGERQTIWFDGDGYLCNDEGKTIHKFHRGGVLHLGDAMLPEAA